MEKEYKKFMENIENNKNIDQDNQMPEFQNMLSGLLQELGNNGEGKAEDMQNLLHNLEHNLPHQQSHHSEPQLENFANSLLNEFMDKDIIYEPLLDARREYQ